MELVITLRTRTALTTVTTLATITAVTMLTTLSTFGALRTLTTALLRLYIVSRLLDEYTVRELELTSLGVNLQELHLNLVTLLDASFLDSLQTLPVNLRDVEQTVLARHELYEAAVRHDAANGTLVDLTDLRDGNDSLDLGDSGIDALLVRTADLNLANTVFLVDSDGSTGVFLHLLDDLSARANDSTNELLRNRTSRCAHDQP